MRTFAVADQRMTLQTTFDASKLEYGVSQAHRSPDIFSLFAV